MSFQQSLITIARGKISLEKQNNLENRIWSTKNIKNIGIVAISAIYLTLNYVPSYSKEKKPIAIDLTKAEKNSSKKYEVLKSRKTELNSPTKNLLKNNYSEHKIELPNQEYLNRTKEVRNDSGAIAAAVVGGLILRNSFKTNNSGYQNTTVNNSNPSTVWDTKRIDSTGVYDTKTINRSNYQNNIEYTEDRIKSENRKGIDINVNFQKSILKF